MAYESQDLTGTEFERADKSLNTVLTKEWHHRLFAERDLSVLEERS